MLKAPVALGGRAQRGGGGKAVTADDANSSPIIRKDQSNARKLGRNGVPVGGFPERIEDGLVRE